MIAAARDALATLADRLPRRDGRVRLRLAASHATIELDNPAVHNAFTARMMADLASAVVELSVWPGPLVVVRAATPGTFCAGGHLDEVAESLLHPEAAATMTRSMTTILDQLRDLPVVSVAVLEGLAVGGGAELATATDLRFATSEASIRFVHTRLGVVPGWGGTKRLRDIVGDGLALRILVEARPISAQRALELGLVDDVVVDADSAVRSLVSGLEAAPVQAVRAVKSQIVSARRGDRAGEAQAFLDVWGNPAHVSALARGRRR